MDLKIIFPFLKRQKSAISFTLGSLFNSAAQIVSSVIILAYIEPNELGLWNSILLFETYSLFLQAGIINGLNRELPYYLGKNDKANAYSLASTALYFFIVSMGLCLVIGSGLLLFNLDKELIFKLTFMGILAITITKFYENYLMSTFRSNHAFGQLAWVYFFRGGFLLLSTLLVVYFGYAGYMIRMVLTSIIITFLMHIIRPIKVKPIFNYNNFKLLFKVGAPIFILAYLFKSSATIDRLLLIKFANLETVGHYSLGIMVMSAFSVLPNTLANYIYPKMSFSYGKTDNIKNLIKKAFKVNLVVSGIMLPIALTGFLVLPLLVPLLFPEYIKGISSAQILIFAVVLSGSTIGINIFWSLKLWKYIIISQLGGTFLNLALIYGCFRLFSNHLIGVSFGILFSNLGYFILTNSLMYVVNRNGRPSDKVG